VTDDDGVPADEGVPAGELSDAELERQGVQAHATRHWIFLHGTAEQFRTHTRRMLELEEEYLRRHPQRTWQGSGGGEAVAHANPALDPDQAKARLLAVFAGTPGGAMHKLEAHQVARSIAPNSRLVAELYKADPALLRAEGDSRVITEAGRAWLAARSA
jgi:Family of unknown function (DUF6158)